MRKVRAKLKHPHTTSRKGYARLAKELVGLLKNHVTYFVCVRLYLYI